MNNIAYGVGVVTGVVAVIFVILLFSGKNTGPLDDTDNKLTGERSDLRIRIDHGTGCQYLLSSKGGLTPRLDVDGKQICRSRT